MAKTKRAEPHPYTMERFGILNPYGSIWSVNTFDTEDEARRYIYDFWKQDKSADLTRFKVVPVNVTVTVRGHL